MRNQERQAERRKHWNELVARQKQSGKTVEAFCQENGVGSPSFYAWRKRLKGRNQAVGFALVETGAPSPQRSEPIELMLSSGDRLQIGPGVDLARLKLVLSALREPR
jgi:transposase-like protein